jgi:hypothetical protein
MDGTELEALADRLRRVERTLHWAGTGWLACVVAVTVLGAGAQRAVSQPAIQGTINARTFVILDESNRPRLEIGISRGGNPGIWLYDPTGKTRVRFSVDFGTRPEVTFANRDEIERMHAGAKSNGDGGVWMFNHNGRLTWSAPRGMFGGVKP